MKSRDRGAVTVEFALVAPLVVLLVSAVAGMGLVAAWSAFAESAARAGARFAAVKANQGMSTPGAPPGAFPGAAADASVSSDGRIAVDPDGTVHVNSSVSASGSATPPPVPAPPDPDALDADPDRTDAVCSGSRPYPSDAEVAREVERRAVFVGAPVSVVVTPSHAQVAGDCPHEGDLFKVTVTYKVPGIESILQLAGLGGLGTITQTVSGRRE
jgi:hypothetical protein